MSHIIQAITAGAAPLAGGETAGASAETLDQRALSALAQLSGSAVAQQDRLLGALRTSAADPMQLLGAQSDLAKFQVEMAVTASLARKAVAAIETLVKSS